MTNRIICRSNSLPLLFSEHNEKPLILNEQNMLFVLKFIAAMAVPLQNIGRHVFLAFNFEAHYGLADNNTFSPASKTQLVRRVVTVIRSSSFSFKYSSSFKANDLLMICHYHYLQQMKSNRRHRKVRENPTNCSLELEYTVQ